MGSTGPFVGPVVPFVDPYAGVGGDKYVDATTASSPDRSARAVRWMDDHPGRWISWYEDRLVGNQKIKSGTTSRIPGLDTKVYEFTSRTNFNCRVTTSYVRRRHPEGESIDEAISRTPAPHIAWPVDLPTLEKSKFGWTDQELADAIEHAKTIRSKSTVRR